MKAFLLAAGVGSRLGFLTADIPKCLLPIADKPLLGWWLELLKRHGVTEVLINTHHHREQVCRFIEKHNETCKLPYITEFYEQVLLGSGGTVLANKDYVKDEKDFLICYADILTNADISTLYAFHKNHDGVLTIALAPTNTPEQAGIVTLDETGVVTEFVEKPENPKSNLANGGIYIARQSIFPHFPQQDFIDFAADVLQNLTGKMYGQVLKGYHMDIGTPENYYKAQKEWSKT